MNFNYVPSTGQIIQTSQGMSPGDILVATFTTPATIASGTGAGGGLNFTDNYEQLGTIGSLSTRPCSFNAGTWPAGDVIKSGQLSAAWSFTSFHLAPNTQYFLNIKSDSSTPLSVKLTAK